MLVQSLDILIVLKLVHGHFDCAIGDAVMALERILREEVVSFRRLALGHGRPEEPIFMQVGEVFLVEGGIVRVA